MKKAKAITWWRRLLLVGAAGAVPVAIVSLVLIKLAYSTDLNFAAQERRGLEFLSPVEQLLDLLPRFAAEDTASSGKADELQARIENALAAVAANIHGESGRALKFSDADLTAHKREAARLALLQSNWSRLKSTPPASPAREQALGAALDSVHAMIDYTADASDLILDNQLDSYYLMDALLRKLPLVQQLQGEIALQAGHGRLPENRVAFAVTSALLQREAVDHILQRDIPTCLAEDKNLGDRSASLQTNLPVAAEKFRVANARLLQLLARATAGENVSAAELGSSAWSARDQSFQFWQTGARELDRLISIRTAAIQARRREYYFLIFGTLLLATLPIGLLIRSLLTARFAEGLRMSQALRLKEQQLRAIGDNLPEGMVYQIMRELDGTMRFLYVSAGVERLVGLRAEELLRDAAVFHERISPEDLPAFLAARKSSLANREVFQALVRIRRTDGQWRWMHFSSHPQRLPDGRFLWDGIVTDVTASRERELNAERLAAIVKFSQDAIISKDTNGIVTTWNPGAEKIFGYTAAEMVGTSITRLIPPERLAEEDYILGRIRNGDSVEHFETQRLTRDGRRIDVAVTASPIRDATGQIIGASKVARDITERKRTESALQMSEQLFRAAFENAMVGVALVGLDGRFLQVNRTLCEKLGYTAEELKQKTFQEVTHEEDRHIGPDLLAKVRAGETKGARFEKRYRHKDGHIVWVHISAMLLDLKNGGRQQFISYIRDITVEKNNARRIQHLNRVYAVLSGINETIVRERDLSLILKTACRIAVERGEFRMAWIGLLDESTQVLTSVASAGVEDGCTEFADMDMRDPLRASGPGGQAMATGEHFVCNDIEHDPAYEPWRAGALRRGYRSSCGFPLKVQGGVVGLFCLYADEPEFFNREELQLLDELASDIGFAIEVDLREARRRDAEESLRQSEKRFSKIFQSSPFPISLTNLANGKFMDANESFFRMSGFTREETIGHSAVELNIYPDPARRTVIMEQLHRQGYLHAHEQQFRAKSGQIRNHILWIERIIVSGEELLLVIALDVTEQKQAEQQQKILEEQLRQAQKLEALGTLAGGIAHDFNNILGAIISFSELSRMDHPHDAELQENLGQVLKASDRATSLVRQILSFSRQQKHERRNLQLASVVKEALDLLRATLPSTIEMRQVIAPGLPDVLANPTQIHQVVMNLCTNAGHAMKGAPGCLTVGLDRLSLKSGEPPPPVALPGTDYVRLTIADTGHGMDEATVKRIFEPFFTTKGPGEGTGLGLSVVHGIVKEHDGVIAVDSAPGKGTTFTIYFPARTAASVDKAAGTSDFPRGNGERVFFVDDEPALGEVGKKMLARLGYRPAVFSHPHAALAAIQKEPHACDLLISDFTMPAMTGLELARQVRQVRPGLPVLLTSGNGGALTAAEIQAAGVNELMVKPLDYQTLARSLAKVLRQNPPDKSA